MTSRKIGQQQCLQKGNINGQQTGEKNLTSLETEVMNVEPISRFLL